MSRLSSPGVVAGLAFALALAVWPDIGMASRWPAAEGALVGLAALLVAGLFARGGQARFLSLGALTVAGGLGYDAVRGERGRVELSPGETTRVLREIGRGGRAIGLRPLGFDLTLQDARPDGSVVLAAHGEPRTLTRARAAAIGRYRFGAPRPAGSTLAHLVVSVSDGSGREERGVVAPAGAARIAGLDVSLERYFPDFALDERQQPYTRSAEPHNPAALLNVSRGDASWRVFVIRALPGIHRPDGLDRVLRLEEVQGVSAVRLEVSREPAVVLAGVGGLIALGALVWRRS